jgi:hypothetical protein
VAKSPPDKDIRDANLDALKSAVSEYVDKEMERLDNEDAFLKEVLKGRGSSEAASKNLAEATRVASVSIDAFLTGE